MAQNPLSSDIAPGSQPATNPLARGPKRAGVQQDPQMHPMLAHAKIWQHVNSLDGDELEQKTGFLDYLIPVLGKLAGNPKTTGKDVIKAVAGAAADGQIEPSQGVAFIQQIPENQEDIRPWLRGLYAANLTGAVHIKAAGIQQAAAAQQAAVQAPESAPTQPEQQPQGRGVPV